VLDKPLHPDSWKTKPTDRFVLKWIKCNLSARITPRLVEITWLRAWMITVCSMVLGVASGALFATGWGFPAGVVAAVSQVLDGVDGQFARLTGTQTRGGAFLDSVLDRYTDGALVIGLILYNVGTGALHPILTGFVGAAALIGSGLISYTSARAENLAIDLGKPTLASKGTRNSVVALSGILSPLSSLLPLGALIYLALHTNVVVTARIRKASRA
jgi:phosphatidylglycerophosphate synthase